MLCLKSKILTFLIISLSFINVYAQQKQKLLYNSKLNYSQRMVDSIMISSHLEFSLKEYKKILESDKSLLGWTKYYQGMSSKVSKKYQVDSIIYYANKGLNEFKSSKLKRPIDEQFLVQLLNLKGYAYRQKKDYSSALKYYQEALNLEKRYPFKWRSYIVTGIAAAHKDAGNDSLALRYYKEAISDSLYLTVPRANITTRNWIGTLYEKLNKVDSALFYYHLAIKESYRLKYHNDIASIYGNIGSLYYRTNEVEKIKESYSNAIKANEKYGLGSYHGAYISDLYFRGYVNVNSNKVSKGLVQLKKVIDSISSFEKYSKADKDIYLKAHKTLSNAILINNSYENIIGSRELIVFLEKFYKQQQIEDLQNLEIKYQAREKAKFISQLENDKLQQEIIINQQKLISYSLIGFILLFVGLIYILWRQRRIKNQYEKENLEQRLLRSQMNPHFIGNCMNTISVLVAQKSEKSIAYINAFSNLFREVLHNSREEFVTMEEELELLRNYLDLQSEFSQKFDYCFDIANEIDLKAILIPPMFLQPIIENAIVHGIPNASDKGQIKTVIFCDVNSRILHIEIEDNGYKKSRMSNSKLKKSPGNSVSVKIINERLQVLSKKFKRKLEYKLTQQNKGMKASLSLPLIIDE